MKKEEEKEENIKIKRERENNRKTKQKRRMGKPTSRTKDGRITTRITNKVIICHFIAVCQLNKSLDVYLFICSLICLFLISLLF
jgi:hypothetical protein